MTISVIVDIDGELSQEDILNSEFKFWNNLWYESLSAVWKNDKIAKKMIRKIEKNQDKAFERIQKHKRRVV